MLNPKPLLHGVAYAIVAVVKAEPVRVATWLVALAAGAGLVVPDQVASVADIATVLTIIVGGETARTQTEPKE